MYLDMQGMETLLSCSHSLIVYIHSQNPVKSCSIYFKGQPYFSKACQLKGRRKTSQERHPADGGARKRCFLFGQPRIILASSRTS